MQLCVCDKWAVCTQIADEINGTLCMHEDCVDTFWSLLKRVVRYQITTNSVQNKNNVFNI